MKTMLVTGASSGVGWALAVRAARAGYAVYGVGRNVDALAALRAKIEAENGIVQVDATDIAEPAHAPSLVARTLAQFGSIDVLVNNAGFVSAGPLVAQNDAELRRQFGTHVIGPIALVREALPALRASRGHVFMLGSGVARIPVGGMGAYPPAKAAIRSASAILRRELAPHGIGLTYVDPGAVDTPFMKRAGMPGAPGALLVSPEIVARKILIAVGDRPRELNAVGWQSAIVGLAEKFPRLTDALMARAPGLVGGETPASDPASSSTDTTAIGAARAESAVHDDESSDTWPVESPATAASFAPVEQPPVRAPSVISEAEVTVNPFDAALEPHRRRMDKLNLRADFVRALLVPDTVVEAGDVAMRWAGMPNKNERWLTEEVLAALAAGGFLEPTEDRAYRVVRSARETEPTPAHRGENGEVSAGEQSST